MFKREFRLRLYLGGITGGYFHVWQAGVDNDLCEIAIFLEDLQIVFYEKMMQELENSHGIFANTEEGVKRENNRICFVTYFSNFEEQTWISYSSFLMLIEDWKQVLLYFPSEVMLHRKGEEVWLTFEKVPCQKAFIKDSLENGYYVFASTDRGTNALANSLLKNSYELAKDVLAQEEWRVLYETFTQLKNKKYFMIFLEKNDEKWFFTHGDTTLSEFGCEVYISDDKTLGN